MKRKFIYIGLGGVALIFVTLVALGGEPAAATPAPVSASLNSNATQLFVEPLPPESALVTAAPDDSKNITATLGASIADELIKQNPQGPDHKDGISSIAARDPQELITKILTEQFEKVSPQDFRTTISVNELTIVPDGKGAYAEFAEKWREIMAPFLALTIPAQNPRPRDFSPLSAVAAETVRRLKALPVPALFAVGFAHDIELIELHRAIFSAIANTDSDPYRASIGLQLWREATEEFEPSHQDFMNRVAREAQTL